MSIIVKEDYKHKVIRVYRAKKPIINQKPTGKTDDNFELISIMGIPEMNANLIVCDVDGEFTYLDKVLEDYDKRIHEAENKVNGLQTTLKPKDLKQFFNVRTAKEAYIKLRERTLQGNFEGLSLGDYIDFESWNDGEYSTTWNASQENLRVQIIAFDHYYNVGSTSDVNPNSSQNNNAPHHVVMQWKQVLRQRQVHSSNVSDYRNTTMQSYLNGAFLNHLKEQIGVSPYTVQRLVGRRTGTGNWESGNTWDWQTDSVFLATEIEVFGTQAWCYGFYSVGTSTQFMFYSLYPQARIKYFNGSRQWWWLNAGYSTTGFARVDNGGRAGYAGASDTGGGLAPVFII